MDPTPASDSPHAYRGWRGTRLHLALIAMSLIAGAYALAGFPAEQYATFTMSLLGAAGIYTGAETAARFAAPKP
jgi:hypothetical protein